MRRVLILALGILLALSMAVGAGATLEVGVEIEASPDLYSGAIDLSEHETIYMYLVGDTPEDWDMVLGLMNEVFERDYNTTLEVTFLSWSDVNTMYTLVIAGGDKIDCIYTANWEYLWEEAAKDSWFVLTDEFIETYMPLTHQYQDPASWAEVTYAGERVAITYNHIDYDPTCIGIRTDLAATYGFELGPIETWEDLEAYMLEVAAHTADTGIYAWNAGSTDTGISDQYFKQFGIMRVAKSHNYRFVYEEGVIPTFEDLDYYYTSDLFYDWCLKANELYNAGCWSRSALNKTETAAQSFGTGTGAVVCWNMTVWDYMYMANELEGVTTAAYTLYPDDFCVAEPYNNNCMAITASSTNKERTAMIIDICKFDSYMNALIQFGVEGYHWIDNGNGTFSAGEFADRFIAKNNALSWAINNGNWTEVFKSPEESAMHELLVAHKTTNPTNSFAFDKEPVSAYDSAITALINEYRYALTLGITDDMEAFYSQFQDALADAGLAAWEAEYGAQYAAWYNSQI